MQASLKSCNVGGVEGAGACVGAIVRGGKCQFFTVQIFIKFVLILNKTVPLFSYLLNLVSKVID
jgi:hypothetical protein